MLYFRQWIGLFVFVAVVSASGMAQAQLEAESEDIFQTIPGDYGPLGIVRLESVQKELGLEGEALAKLNKVLQSHLDERTAELDKAGLPKNVGQYQKLAREERLAAMGKIIALKRTLNEKYTLQLKEATTSAQFERLHQIRWQWLGIRAVEDPEMAKLLNVTEDQHDKIEAIWRDYKAKFRELIKARGNANFDYSNGLAKDRDAKVREVLTKEQQEKYTNLKGKPVDDSRLFEAIDQISGR